LGPEHLTSIKAFRHPQFVGVDLNSQFEIAPALKSVDKLQLFINEFRKNN
jgi:phosphoribosylanthranilate isomerase